MLAMEVMAMVTLMVVMVAMVGLAMPGTFTPSQSTRPLTPPCSASADGWDLTMTHLMPALLLITLPAAPLPLLPCKALFVWLS